MFTSSYWVPPILFVHLFPYILLFPSFQSPENFLCFRPELLLMKHLLLWMPMSCLQIWRRRQEAYKLDDFKNLASFWIFFCKFCSLPIAILSWATPISFTNQVEITFSICHYQWDGVENKSTVLLYGGGALVAVWLSSILVSAINSVPLVSHQLYLQCFIFMHYKVFWTNLRQFVYFSASKDYGVGRTRVHWMVCLPIPSV